VGVYFVSTKIDGFAVIYFFANIKFSGCWCITKYFSQLRKLVFHKVKGF